jgi:PmbA protein
MEKLIQLARDKGYDAEGYGHSSQETSVAYQNGLLQDIESSFHSGVSLRLIKDGLSGYAYTKNLLDREQLIRDAEGSLVGGVEAPFRFPVTRGVETIEFDQSLEQVTSATLVDECVRIDKTLRSQISGEIMVGATTMIANTRIINTAGTDLATKYGYYGCNGGGIYPGSAAGISRSVEGPTFTSMSDELVSEVANLYSIGDTVIDSPSGKMKVLFLPESMVTFVFRLSSGMSAKSLYDGISPLAERTGEQLFSPILSIYNDPTDRRFVAPRLFDDEGVPCTRFPLIEAGVFKGFFNDLHYAAKLDCAPTGHGFRTSMWGGDPTSQKPMPSLTRLVITPGNDSFAELIGQMDRGVIIGDPLGPHSGNIPNGDYSVGVCPGFYVEDGKIKGRIKDTMVSGNIYETLNHVSAVGDRLYPSWGGYFPAVLCDDVSVAARS